MMAIIFFRTVSGLTHEIAVEAAHALEICWILKRGNAISVTCWRLGLVLNMDTGNWEQPK